MPSGSSPHTRGTRLTAHGCGYVRGDHPRIRGEHFCGRPHAGVAAGIIPAYAGNTRSIMRTRRRSLGSSPHTRGTRSPAALRCGSVWDHPRIRGEHVPLAHVRDGSRGIIPAYAGNTEESAFECWDIAGSSPHTRGTPRQRFQGSGNPQDHPRIRGEHTYLPAIPIPGVAVLYHFIQSDGPCASCLHRSSLTSWLHSSSHLRNRSASPSKPNHRNPWASSWIDEHEMQHVAHYWPNRPLSPCHR